MHRQCHRISSSPEASEKMRIASLLSLEVSAFMITKNIKKMAFEQALNVQKPEYK